MVGRRGQTAQKAVPKQKNSGDSRTAGTVFEIGGNEGVQNGVEKEQEVRQIPWRGLADSVRNLRADFINNSTIDLVKISPCTTNIVL